MTWIRPNTRPLVALILCLLIVGLWQVGEGTWIYAKARLAQLLLQRAWSRTLEGQIHVKPWPWADTWPVARLTVPSREIDLIVLNGAYGRTLAFGPGYAESSSAPGSHGTTIVIGHRDTHFRFLRRLQEGDAILLQSSLGHVLQYRVHDRRIIPEAGPGIPLWQDKAELVLLTCYPFGSLIAGGPLRYVVTAELEMGGARRFSGRE
jgi:sortase A